MMGVEDLGGRLALLKPEALTPEARALYEQLTEGRLAKAPFRSRTDTGALIGPFNVLLHAPAIGSGFIAFHEAEERATPLPPRMREVVILSVGAVWGSPYEIYAHRAVAIAQGVEADVVAALVTGEPSPQLSEEDRAVQRFTLELTRDRVVSDDSYRRLEVLVGRDAVIAIVHLAAAYTATCTILNAFAVPAP